MNISLDLYNYFYYVAEFQSITKAANFLYVSQPAITKQIRNLEAKLGKKLINRTNTGIELTYDGNLLYKEIKEAIEILNGVEGRFREKSEKYQEEIKIVAGHTSSQKYLIPAMSKFNRLHPEIKFKLSTYRYKESIQMLREGKVDLIYLSLKEVGKQYSNICIEKKRDAQDIFVIRKEDKDKYPSKINLLDLNNYNIISLESTTITRQELDKIYKQNGKKFTPTYELSNYWIVEEYVNLGLGIGIVVKDLVQEKLDSGEYVEIKTDKPLPTRETGYAYRKNALNYNILKEFINIMK